MTIPLCIALFAFCLYQNTSFFMETPEVKVSFEKMTKFIDRADSGRFELWSTMLSDMSLSNMIFGKGYYFSHSYAERLGYAFTHPHSAFMFSFFHGGIILLIFHGLILFECFVHGLADFREKKSPLLLLLLGFSLFPQLTNGITIYDIVIRFSEMVIIFWTMVGIALKKELKV